MMNNESDYHDIPPLNSFIDITDNYSRLMTYRNSKSANHYQIQKRGRFLREMRDLQLIQYDLQHYNMNLERKKMHEEALFLAQQIDYLTDPVNIQREQLDRTRTSYQLPQEYQPPQFSFTEIPNTNNEEDNFMTNPSFDSLEIRQSSNNNYMQPTPRIVSRFRR